MQLKGKTIAVVGFSPRTGLELVKYLQKHEVDLIVSDSKSEAELKNLIAEVDAEKIKFDLASHSDSILNSDLIILSPGVPFDLEILKRARNNDIETISEIEFAYRQSEAEIIAVTGTNGKTTTAELLAAMLSDLDGKKVKVAGNIGIPFISLVEDLKKDEKIILELSSFQLEAVKDFRAKIALYLNYSPDHLDRHHTEANYKKAKKKVFINQDNNDYAIINFDDDYLYSLKTELKSRVLGISTKNKDADLVINDAQAYYKKEKLELIDFKKINIPGVHNRKNIAFAALAAYLAGQNVEKIKNAAENYHLQAHRMEIVDNKQGFLIIDDSKATNPDSTLKALESIEKDIILIAGGQDRNADFSKLAEVIKKSVKSLILIGETAEKIASYLKAEEMEIIIEENLEKAAQTAIKKLNGNNALLLSPACPSWDMFSSYKERGEIFKNTVLKSIN